MASSRLLGNHAVVIGGGIAGLMTARILSDYFSHVSVLERDAPSPPIAPRQGVPQGKHVHILLASGEQILAGLFPGIREDLEQAGAVKLSVGYDVLTFDEGERWPRRDLGIQCHAQSRPLLEHCVRRRLMDIENTSIVSGCRVTGLRTTPDFASVTGVAFKSHAETTGVLDADLIVDTSGRHAKTPQWLTSLGYQAVQQTSVDINLCYATAVYNIPPSHSIEALGIAARGTASSFHRGGYLQTIEGNRWIVTLAGKGADHPPTETQGFVRFAKSLPTMAIYNAIRHLEPTGKINPFRVPTSVLRHYERLTRFPAGLLVLGDAICSFNPIYAQGMSAAAKQVEVLDVTLRALCDGDLTWQNLATCFFRGAADAVSAPWIQSYEADAVHPKIGGKQRKKLERRRAYTATLRRIAMVDPDVHRQVIRVMNLIDPPSVLVEEVLCRRVMTEQHATPRRKAA